MYLRHASFPQGVHHCLCPRPNLPLLVISLLRDPSTSLQDPSFISFCSSCFIVSYLSTVSPTGSTSVFSLVLPPHSLLPSFVKTMVLKPLEVLQKGLEVLTSRTKSRKDALQARLAEAESISSEDEHWLDYEANLVDEQQVLEALGNAPDYEQGFAGLSDEQKDIVKRPREAAGDLSKAIGKKQRRESRIFLVL